VFPEVSGDVPPLLLLWKSIPVVARISDIRHEVKLIFSKISTLLLHEEMHNGGIK
jgi:hypothetical protein